MSDDLEDVDLNYAPKSYFVPHGLERHLVSKIKSAVIRADLNALLDQGEYKRVREVLIDEERNNAFFKAMGRSHPMFLGGNYLPDTEEGEIEIARLCLRSVTYDVAAVYVRREQGVIHYRVVDEHDGMTLHEEPYGQSETPMTLEAFTAFVVEKWGLDGIVNDNDFGTVQEALDFFWAESYFYPDLDLMLRHTALELFPEREVDEDDDWTLG
jgi:hypothetical protein